jgi:hypothetical protein
MFHLKRNPNYNNYKLWWHQYKKANELFYSFYLLERTYRTALHQLTITFSKTHKHLLCSEVLLPAGVLLSYYFLVRIRIAKCFTNSSKRFRCEVMFENEHTFCSWIHHVRTCTAFAQLSCIGSHITLIRLTAYADRYKWEVLIPTPNSVKPVDM